MHTVPGTVSYPCKAFTRLDAWLTELDHGLQHSEVYRQPVGVCHMSLSPALLQPHAVPCNPEQTRDPSGCTDRASAVYQAFMSSTQTEPT